MAKTENTSGGIGLGTTLFLIFLIFKLTNTVDWSWWWIFSPLWIPLVFVIFVMFLIGLFTVVSK